MIYLEVRDEGRHNIIKKLVIISTRVLVDLLFVGAKTSSEKRGVPTKKAHPEAFDASRDKPARCPQSPVRPP